MNFFRIYQHLLPQARAWRLTASKKLREFFEGLAPSGDDTKTFFDEVWEDVFPETTRELEAWEQQFDLRSAAATEQERRTRLDAAWKETGGQDPRYIQDTLQRAGFFVFVHEWWVPGTEPPPGVKACVTPRNPLLYLRPDSSGPDPRVDCGEPLAACGEAFAECGNGITPLGYPLVNIVYESEPDYLVLCGEAVAECGEPDALCGDYLDFVERRKVYIIPQDPSTWPYFLYIGGETFPELATIDPARRDEFERLCLKICPNQQWLGILVSYT